MHRLLTTAVLGAAAMIAGADVATAAAPDPDNVATLLAQMRAASGGDAWNAIRSLHWRSEGKSGGEPSSHDHREDVATGRYSETEVQGGVAWKDGFDGVTAWRQGRSGIPYALGDVDSSLVAADEAFRVARGWWFRDRHSGTVALLGMRADSGSKYDVLAVTPEGGRPFEAWVDQATHLLWRIDEQQAEDRVVTTYADYRRVHDVLLPFAIRTGDGAEPEFDSVETVTSIAVNVEMPDSVYALPPCPTPDIQLPPGVDHVDVPFRLTPGNRLLVPITIDSRVTTEAEFDSGGGLLLQPETVAAAGLSSKGRHQQRGGGEGSTTSSAGRLHTLSIGGATIVGAAFHSFAFRPSEPRLALVGLEVLQRFVVRFDFDRLVMTLTRPDTFRYSGLGAVVPFHFQDNQPEVKGSVDGIAGLFTIDTGDSGSLLLIAPFARRYRLIERYGADIPYDGRAVTATHGVWARRRVGSVALDGPDGRAIAEAHNPVTRISLQHAGFDADRDVSGNIGLGILRQFNLTFDYQRQRLILERNHLYGQRDVGNRTGLSLQRDRNAWQVTAVYAGSPAAAVGLHVGDRIVRIGGRTPADLDENALDTLLHGAVGAALAIDVGVAAGSRPVVLILRDVT